MAASIDVAVIGGGIIGTATAGFLAEAGARVVLYEREALASGASGRNSGVVQHPFDLELVPLYEETIRIYRRVGAEIGAGIVDLDRPAPGLLLASRHPQVVRALTARLGRTHPSLAATFLEGDELRALEPSIGPDVSACRLAMGYPVIPSAPTFAFATAAERRGVTIRLGRGARPATRAGRCIGVEVDGRVEGADAVVVAAGPWTPELVDPTGAWRPIRPVWGVVVETLLRNPPGHSIEEAEMDEALGTGDLAVQAGVETVGSGDDGPEPEFSLITAGGVSAVGSTFLDEEPDPEAWTERILRRGMTFVPGLLDAPIRDVHACARPVALDGRPLTGRIPWIEDLYVAAGHGPWGISTGPASARQVADLMLGRDAGIQSAFDPGRFGSPGIAAE